MARVRAFTVVSPCTFELHCITCVPGQTKLRVWNTVLYYMPSPSVVEVSCLFHPFFQRFQNRIIFT